MSEDERAIVHPRSCPVLARLLAAGLLLSSPRAQAEPAQPGAQTRLRVGPFASVGPYYNGYFSWSGEVGATAVVPLGPTFHMVAEGAGTWIAGSRTETWTDPDDYDVHDSWRIASGRGLVGMRVAESLDARAGPMLGYAWYSYDEPSHCGSASRSGVTAGAMAELAAFPSPNRRLELGARIGLADVPQLDCRSEFENDEPRVYQADNGIFTGISLFFLTLKVAFYF